MTRSSAASRPKRPWTSTISPPSLAPTEAPPASGLVLLGSGRNEPPASRSSSPSRPPPAAPPRPSSPGLPVALPPHPPPAREAARPAHPPPEKVAASSPAAAGAAAAKAAESPDRRGLRPQPRHPLSPRSRHQGRHDRGRLPGCGGVVDIALDKDSKLIGATFGGLYTIDKGNAHCTLIAGGSYPNSLSFVPAGTVNPEKEALVGYLGSTYVRIDPQTGTVSNIGALSGGYVSSGDIVSVKGGKSLLTVNGQGCGDCIVEVNPTTGNLVKNWGPVAAAPSMNWHSGPARPMASTTPGRSSRSISRRTAPASPPRTSPSRATPSCNSGARAPPPLRQRSPYPSDLRSGGQSHFRERPAQILRAMAPESSAPLR